MFGFVKRRHDGADKRLECRRLVRGVTEAVRERESVGSRQRGKPRAGRIRKLARGLRRARAQADDTAGKGEKVPHPVTHFSQEQMLSFTRFSQLGDVARDF